jgi:two-component system response regulator AtoC
MQVLGTRYDGSASAFEWRDQRVPFPDDEVLFGRAAAMEAVRTNIPKVASTNVPVLITGESGTGKQVVAQFVHRHSAVANGPFVQINCAAVPSSLIENEWFGSEKGSFTGANSSKRGRVELAESGTLFLDEISEMDPGIQAKLLHLLQDGRFRRLGGNEETQVNVRFIFASNRDLEVEIARGTFREDLYFRINVVNLSLPPLRDRREDIPILVGHFLTKYNQRFARSEPPLSAPCLDRLQEYDWPGNIRQLENLMKRYVVLGSEHAIHSELNESVSDSVKFTLPSAGGVSLKQIKRQAARQLERKVILKIVEDSGWNRKRAARRLNISYRALLYKLKGLGVPMVSRGSRGKTDERNVAAVHCAMPGAGRCD